MKKVLIVDVISYLFILLFLYTGISKILTFSFFDFDLALSPILKGYSHVIAITLPIVEIIVAVSLFIPRTRTLGLWASLFLMIIFTGYVGYILAFKHQLSYVPCTCGGIFRKMSWPMHLVVNIIFTLLGITGIVLQKKIFKLTERNYSL